MSDAPRHLHFDLVGGIAGDMTVAALLDAGASLELLREALRASGLPAAELSLRREWRGGLAGLRFEVAVESDAPHRSWKDIRAMLEQARLPGRARALALDMFARLAEAEAAVHGCPVDEVHFHEVGALDSIVDIVAAALAVEQLGATSFSASAVPVCQGRVRGDHGWMPLPAPATAELLRGFTLITVPGSLETVTPTGAAILASLVDTPDAPPPTQRLLATGAGLGAGDLPGRANVLRVLLGERVSAPADEPAGTPSGRAVVIEASIDDMDPRLFASVSRHLFEAGALDVTLTPLQMKKQRPGTLLSVVCRPELEGLLSGLLLRETTTLGVRSHDVRRTELERRFEPVDTRFGPITVKLGLLGGECVNLAPEYDDCERAAREHGVPVKDVLAAAAAAAEALRTPRQVDR